MIDRKITLALILALVVESAGVFAWFGATSVRLQDVEQRVAAQGAMIEQLARVEVQLEQAMAQLTRIEERLGR